MAPKRGRLPTCEEEWIIMAKNRQETKQRNRAAMSRANGTAGTGAGFNQAGGAGAYEFGGELGAGVTGAGASSVAKSKQQSDHAMRNAMKGGGAGGSSKSK